MSVEIDDLVSERRELVENGGRWTNGCDSIMIDDDPAVDEDSAF